MIEVSAGRVDRVAILSVHTCPLDQPGTGDSGGMNVLVRSVARRLAGMGTGVDVFTRRAGPEQSCVEMDPRVRCIHLAAGPPRPVAKEDLHAHLPEFLCSLLSFGNEEARRLGRDRPYDVVHGHYWLSGWAARRAAERWGVPLVHSFHTLGRVKDLSLAGGDSPESPLRIAGEESVVRWADCLLVPTPGEAAELVHLYGARPERVRVVSPGVDIGLFTPADRESARAALGVGPRPLVLFAGRLQPLKAPDVAVRAVAALAARRPDLDPALVVLGGPSGRNGVGPEALVAVARDLGIADRVRVLPPVPHDRLPAWYRAADVLIVPSRAESFGLVALEAAACGTPVVASDVGGLRTAVRDGTTGLLVPPGSPGAFADALERVLSDSTFRRTLGAAGARFARRFDWRQAAAGLLAVYEEMAERFADRTGGAAGEDLSQGAGGGALRSSRSAG